VVGQERFAYFCLGRHSGFSKVSRRQGGTLSGRYRRNGYVHGPTVLTVRPSSQASQLPHWIAGHQLYLCRLPGRHGSKLPRHRFSVVPKLCRYLCCDSGGSATLGRLSRRYRRQASSHRFERRWVVRISPGPVPLSGPTAPHSAPVQNQTQCRSTSNRQTR